MPRTSEDDLALEFLRGLSKSVPFPSTEFALWNTVEVAMEDLRGVEKRAAEGEARSENMEFRLDSKSSMR